MYDLLHCRHQIHHCLSTFVQIDYHCLALLKKEITIRVWLVIINFVNTRADITNIFILEIKELCYEQYVLHRN
jgi:hypothetical protein